MSGKLSRFLRATHKLIDDADQPCPGVGLPCAEGRGLGSRAGGSLAERTLDAARGTCWCRLASAMSGRSPALPAHSVPAVPTDSNLRQPHCWGSGLCPGLKWSSRASDLRSDPLLSA